MTGGRVFGEGFAIMPESVLYADVSDKAKILWCIFQRHSDVNGRCYPSVGRLKDLMRCSPDTVIRAKKELSESGLIECRARHDDGGRRTTDDIYLPALVRGATRKFAGDVPRTDAGVNSKAVELKPEERNPHTPTHAARRDHPPPELATPIRPPERCLDCGLLEFDCLCGRGPLIQGVGRR